MPTTFFYIKANIDKYLYKKQKPQVAILTAKNLYRAIELRDAHKSYKRIQKETRLSNDDLKSSSAFIQRLTKKVKYDIIHAENLAFLLN